jgi:hypothetical protein
MLMPWRWVTAYNSGHVSFGTWSAVVFCTTAAIPAGQIVSARCKGQVDSNSDNLRNRIERRASIQ